MWSEEKNQRRKELAAKKFGGLTQEEWQEYKALKEEFYDSMTRLLLSYSILIK